MNSQIDSLIIQAAQAFESGSLKSAEHLLEAALKIQKKHLMALHLMGLIKAASADHKACIYFLGQAEKLSPNDPSIQYNLAKAFSDSGNDRSAMIHHERATRLDPQNLMAWLNYGQCLSNLGRFSDALKVFERAHAINPGSLETLLNLGATLKELGQFDKAISMADQALDVNPQFAEAWSNKGSAYKGLNQYEIALDCYEKAVSLQPNNAQFWSNKGVALVALARYEEALDCYENAIKLFPQFAEAWSNKALALNDLRRYQEGLNCCNTAIRIKPDYQEAYWNRALILLTLGKLQDGWSDYEKRWDMESFEKPAFANIPRLNALSEVSGSQILVWSEQGLGDVIQFGRYLRCLQESGGRVTVRVQGPLEKLFKQSGFDLLQDSDSHLHFDYQIPFGSLPALFNTSLESMPGEIPYLQAPDILINDWREKLALSKSGKLNIGIACSGNIHFDLKRGNTRPIPLSLLIKALPKENLFLIQKDLRMNDRETLNQSTEIQFLGDQLTDFEATAAVVGSMDLIISIDTSLAHLAGALSKPTFILLPWAADWRWFLDRSDSPWYPTVRLFRQESFGDWSSAITRMRIELDHFKSERV